MVDSQQLGEWLYENWAGAFVGLFVVGSLLELVMPRYRGPSPGRSGRMTTNLALLMAQGLLQMLLPVSLAGIALAADQNGWGIFQAVTAPAWGVLAVAIGCRTFADYWLHRASHAVPALWRLHRVHHTDRELDLTTGLRHHPLEILPGLALYGPILLVLGLPLWAFTIAELLMIANQLWQHADTRMPANLARPVGAIFVTPDIHRVHHSVERRQTDSNFGVLLSGWDRLFGTYIDPAGTGPLRLGLGPDDDAGADSLWRQLALPFGRAAGSRATP